LLTLTDLQARKLIAGAVIKCDAPPGWLLLQPRLPALLPQRPLLPFVWSYEQLL
jgi:hypothetical protein